MRFNIFYEDRATYGTTRDDALALGYPPEIVEEAIANAYASLISDVCRQRIYKVASPETQMNMAAASAVISSKTASARTESEKAVLVGLEAAIGWVAAMRATVAALAADHDLDMHDDANWPDPPAAALALVDQF